MSGDVTTWFSYGRECSPSYAGRISTGGCGGASVRLLHLELSAELDNPVGRNRKVLSCGPRIPGHEDEDFLAPSRQMCAPCWKQPLSAKEIGRVAFLCYKTERTSLCQDLGHVRLFHEPDA